MNILRTITLCTGLCLLAGCTQEQEETTLPTDAVPLRIASASLPGMTQESSVTTRAGVTLQTGSIGVFCTQPAGAGYTVAQTNVKYNYTSASGKWEPEAENKSVYLLPQTTQVCAYYPYNAGYTNSAAIPLEFGEYTGTANDLSKHDPLDICYAINQGMNSSSVSATFALKHAMALLKLTLTRPKDESTACRITKLELANSSLMKNAIRNITTEAAPTGTATPLLTWTPATALEVPANGTTSVSVTLRMIPCTLAATGLKLTFTIENKPVSVTITNATLSKIEAGKLYDVSLKIGAAGITPTVEVTDWENAYKDDDPIYNTRP